MFNLPGPRKSSGHAMEPPKNVAHCRFSKIRERFPNCAPALAEEQGFEATAAASCILMDLRQSAKVGEAVTEAVGLDPTSDDADIRNCDRTRVYLTAAQMSTFAVRQSVVIKLGPEVELSKP
jgi:hypothetical protein